MALRTLSTLSEAIRPVPNISQSPNNSLAMTRRLDDSMGFLSFWSHFAPLTINSEIVIYIDANNTHHFDASLWFALAEEYRLQYFFVQLCTLVILFFLFCCLRRTQRTKYTHTYAQIENTWDTVDWCCCSRYALENRCKNMPRILSSHSRFHLPGAWIRKFSAHSWLLASFDDKTYLNTHSRSHERPFTYHWRLVAVECIWMDIRKYIVLCLTTVMMMLWPNRCCQRKLTYYSCGNNK